MLSLGDIQFGLGIDTSGLGASVRQVQNFGRNVEQVANSSAAGARQVEAALRRQEAAVLRALQSTLRFNQESRRMGVPVQMINQSNQAFASLSNSMSKGAMSTLAYQRQMEGFQARMGRLKRELTTFDPTPNGAKFKVWLQDMTSSATLALGPLSGVGSRITALSSIISRSSIVAAAFFASVTAGAYAFYKLGQAAVNTSLDLDRVRARLDGLSRSNQEASADFTRIKAIADQTGNSFVILAQEWTNIKAAAKNTTMEGEKSFEMFRNIAVGAGAFRLTGVQVEATFKAISQMMSKGTVQLEELKGQLGDQLPIAMQAAAKAMGVTTTELFKLIKAGKVSSEEFLVPFSRAIAELLGVDPTKRIDTLTASLGRFNNSIVYFNDAINKSIGYSKAFKAVVEAATNAVDYLSAHINDLTKYATLAGVALVAAVAPSIVIGFLNMALAIGKALIGFRAMSAAAMAVPWIRLITIVGSVAAAFYYMRDATEATTQAIDINLSNSVDNYIKLQEGMKAASRNTTKQLIADVQAQVEAIQIQINAMMTARATLNQEAAKNYGGSVNDVLNRLTAPGPDAPAGGAASQLNDLVKQFFPNSEAQAAAATRQLEDLNNQMIISKEQLTKLGEILKKPEFGDLAKPAKVTDDKGLSRADKARRDALQEIARMQETMDAMGGGPVWFAQFEKQEEINKKIQDFRDKLVDAKIPLKEVNDMSLVYAQTLKTMQEQMEGPFAGMQEMFQTFQDASTEAFKAATDAIGRAVVDGKINAELFINIVKDMVAKIISEILTLAIVNPLLNSIFGSTKPTMGGGFMSSIGSMFTGLFSAKGSAYAGGVQFMKAGGLLKGATAFQTGNGMAIGGEAGTEAIMPLTRTKNGDLGVRVQGNNDNNAPIINILNSTGSAVTTRTRKSGGASITDIVIGEVGQGFAKGKFDSSMQGRYQRRPARSGRE